MQNKVFRCRHCRQLCWHSKRNYKMTYLILLVSGFFTCGVTCMFLPFIALVDAFQFWTCSNCGAKH